MVMLEYCVGISMLKGEVWIVGVSIAVRGRKYPSGYQESMGKVCGINCCSVKKASVWISIINGVNCSSLKEASVWISMINGECVWWWNNNELQWAGRLRQCVAMKMACGCKELFVEGGVKIQKLSLRSSTRAALVWNEWWCAPKGKWRHGS